MLVLCKLTSYYFALYCHFNILDEALSERSPKKNQSENAFKLDKLCVDELLKDQIFIDTIVKKVISSLLQTEDFNKAMSMEIQDCVKEMNAQAMETKKQVVKLQEEIKKLSQCTRRNCLIIHGIPCSQNENTNNLAQEFFKEHLDISISDYEIDRSRRLGKEPGLPQTQRSNDERNKSKPIIIKFTRHDIKQKIYLAKRKLAKKNIFDN